MASSVSPNTHTHTHTHVHTHTHAHTHTHTHTHVFLMTLVPQGETGNFTHRIVFPKSMENHPNSTVFQALIYPDLKGREEVVLEAKIISCLK